MKICGITDPRAAEAAVSSGADAIGFVFAPSVRQVTPEHAAAISADFAGTVVRVAVFLQPSVAEIVEVLRDFDADVVQADHRALAGFRLKETLPVYREGETGDLETLLGQNGEPHLLYEGPRSGAGRPVDWARAAGIARRTRMTLAGGLDPDNVSHAIEAVGPHAVDVSSGVESAPGVKDLGRIRDFIAAAKGGGI